MGSARRCTEQAVLLFCANKQSQKSAEASCMLACKIDTADLWRATRTRNAKHFESAYSERQSQKSAEASCMLACKIDTADLWRATRTRNAKHFESAYSERQSYERRSQKCRQSEWKIYRRHFG